MLHYLTYKLMILCLYHTCCLIIDNIVCKDQRENVQRSISIKQQKLVQKYIHILKLFDSIS